MSKVKRYRPAPKTLARIFREEDTPRAHDKAWLRRQIAGAATPERHTHSSIQCSQLLSKISRHTDYTKRMPSQSLPPVF